MRRLDFALLVCASAHAQVPLDWQASLNRIKADSMRGHLSFLASDLLEGRDTPSPGLDIAGQYIAAQFLRAGLEPAGDDGFFQTSTWYMIRQESGATVTLETGKTEFRVPVDTHVSRDVDGMGPAWKIPFGDAGGLDKLTAEDVEGRMVVLVSPDAATRLEERQNQSRWLTQFRRAMQKLNPKLVILADPDGSIVPILVRGRPYAKPPETITPPAGFEMAVLRDAEAVRILRALPNGLNPGALLAARLARPEVKPVKLRNVVGLLRGSDPTLRESYVMLNAHYDHIGKLPPGPGDRIFNGANDDASGSVSVLEIASALASSPRRPRRSIVFAAFFGEEKGILGARYYAQHPIFPLSKTVASLSLEHIGRTDSSEGPNLNSANLTGFDFSTVSSVMVAAGKETGVRIWKHEKGSDQYYGASDNIALAEVGVPAHTLSVTYVFPDYHGLGDEWQKIDYANMEKVLRATALGLLMLADADAAPQWNESNEKTERFRKAQKPQPAGSP
ncbi:MAG: M28 family peptidase [Acidobacteriia bacterium]|nr:M28 family peptidase [Terriglobia bacterium]